MRRPRLLRHSMGACTLLERRLSLPSMLLRVPAGLPQPAVGTGTAGRVLGPVPDRAGQALLCCMALSPADWRRLEAHSGTAGVGPQQGGAQSLEAGGRVAAACAPCMSSRRAAAAAAACSAAQRASSRSFSAFRPCTQQQSWWHSGIGSKQEGETVLAGATSAGPFARLRRQARRFSRLQVH